MSQADLEEFNKPVPYELHVDEELLSVTKQKLQLARYPEEQTDIGDDDWSQGAKVKEVKRLADYWKDGYDWRAEEVLNPPSAQSLSSTDLSSRPRSTKSSTNSWSK